MIIEYPMTKDYVSKWGVWQAVREFLQNAMDAGEYSYHYKDGTLILINAGKLDRNELLLGKSNKSDSDRGQFGEGMKLAMMVLARMNRRITVHTTTEVWTPMISMSKTFDEEVFIIDVEPCKSKQVRVEIELTKGEMAEVTSKWTTADYGILPTKRKGLVFVGGLFVCTMKGLERAYNFKPTQIVLNRDRDIPSMWDIQYAASNYLTDEEKLDMALEGSNDVGSSWTAGRSMASAWGAKYPNAIPLGISEQGKGMIAPEGKFFKIVPNWVANAIRGVERFIVKHTSSPMTRLDEWAKDNFWQLNSVAQRDLEDIIKDMKLEGTPQESEVSCLS
jgi:hypothetical protein